MLEGKDELDDAEAKTLEVEEYEFSKFQKNTNQRKILDIEFEEKRIWSCNWFNSF